MNDDTVIPEELSEQAAAIAASIPQGLMYSFESQAKQYPKSGKPGISHLTFFETFKWRPDVEYEIHALLFRNNKGRVLGVLNYYPTDVPPLERAGNVNIWVDPRRQRRGIATKLLQKALEIWPDIDFAKQRYSPSGKDFITKFLGRDPRNG